ncbi:MAG TPA: glycosyltransferase [Candidatus Omnitrophica bacterium]|nr:MAG: hypothetical protein A2Z81_09895 [Omnitrophica WOR_2 bacterium GWA2_45_18]OGX21633.1 MAG: hypothetical protein A2Y04_04380 [Omnitrophica WOR_2 bacterium GWC2_45_7]HBR15396.1 glycosyltransferase [Candidatus Omnitrophota bacterium]
MDVLGVKVSVTNPQEALRTIAHWIETRQKTYVCIAPVSTIVDCQSDAEYLQIINGAGMTTPDGMPLVWLGKLKGIKSLERTYGPDLMVALCGLSQGKGYRHYFYGGTTKTNELLLTKLKERFPQLIIAGAYAPPFLSMRDREEEHVLAAINQAQPDILWVGLGSPKQDYWMANHRDKLDVPVMIGIGAAFDFIAGTKPQAPVWMRTSGLEWFFRFCCEPKRLWKRYLVGNPKFLYLLCREALSNKRKVSCS